MFKTDISKADVAQLAELQDNAVKAIILGKFFPAHDFLIQSPRDQMLALVEAQVLADGSRFLSEDPKVGR